MFTGIVQAVGHVVGLEQQGGDKRLTIAAPMLDLADVRLGDSIAVSGVCLTIVSLHEHQFSADVSNETLALTNLGQRKVGDGVNLEKALRLADRLGGHMVSGHVDGLGKIVSVTSDGRSQRWKFEVAAKLLRYIVAKGSICIDGVSLTVNEVSGCQLGVNLIPHTMESTTFRWRRPGDLVNLEVDQIARYVERLVTADKELPLDEAFLKEHGYA